jgi:acetoin utilization deacetylase AcuC-like enzyme
MPAFVYSPLYEADIGTHVFPVQKYRRTREMLLASGRVRPEAFLPPRPHGREALRLVHTAGYLDDFFHLRATPATVGSELPLDEPIATWFATAADGTLTAAAGAAGRGAALHIGGGFHHAYADHAEGFCYLNDVAVAARYALEAGWAASVTVVDLDVHQGNGTARIFRDDDRVFTFSMHQQNNYPGFKETSDLDIGLPDGIEDGAYLERLDGGLAESVGARRPNLVFYVAGADPFREDQLGGLALTMEGLAERDRRVYAACKSAGAAVATCLAGGYAMDPDDTARIHVNTAVAMLEAFPEPGAGE